MEATPETTNLTPAEYERHKDAEARVEDIAYTINHALVCSTVDVLGTPLANWTDKHIGFRFKLPGHDHGPGGHDHHGHGSNTWSWLVGEVIGDYLAVPATVAVQRWAPGFMDNLRYLMEPVAGPLFRSGARRAAQSWGAKHGYGQDSPEVQQRAKDIYVHEIRHLPQALMWTASSSALNIGMQYAIEKNRWFGTHMHGTFWQWLPGKLGGKLAASGVTAGVVVLGRGIAPQSAERWDHWTSKNIFLPLTERIGHLFGVTKEDVERMHAKKEAIEKGQSWTKRVEQPDLQEPTLAIS